MLLAGVAHAQIKFHWTAAILPSSEEWRSMNSCRPQYTNDRHSWRSFQAEVHMGEFAGRSVWKAKFGPRCEMCARLLDVYTVEGVFTTLAHRPNSDIRITISEYLRLCPQPAVGIASGGTLNLTAKSSNSIAFTFTVVTNGCSGYADASRLRKVTSREYRSHKKCIRIMHTSKAHLHRLFWVLNLQPRHLLQVSPHHHAHPAAR